MMGTEIVVRMYRQQKQHACCRFSVENVDGKPLERSLTPAVYAKEELAQLGKEFKVHMIQRRWFKVSLGCLLFLRVAPACCGDTYIASREMLKWLIPPAILWSGVLVGAVCICGFRVATRLRQLSSLQLQQQEDLMCGKLSCKFSLSVFLDARRCVRMAC